MIYKILTNSQWEQFVRDQIFHGAPVDLNDGYIHFSSSETLLGTATKHFAGQSDLWLVICDEARFSDTLKWEVSRGGALFPHLYAPLKFGDIDKAMPYAEFSHAS